MALKDYERDMQRCTRCSYCKWIPWKVHKNYDFTFGCPSVARYNWHAYSSGGRFNMAYALLNDRLEYTDGFQDAVFRCLMDGNCDISCKVVQDIEPLQSMHELRIKFIEDGQILPEHMLTIEGLRKEDNMLMAKKADREKWAEGIAVKNLTKEKAEVLFHAGCRYSFDEALWPIVHGGLKLLMDADIDVGIMGRDEACCGGRAYSMGFSGELTKYAEHNMEAFKTAGAKTLVTPCSDCYQCFKVLYDAIGKKPDIEILHITEYLHRMIKDGTIKLTKEVPLTVTYHDPCHLGRLAEPWIHWNGKETEAFGGMIVHDPPKKFRRGANGVYEIPREILKSIPGLRLIEMYRIKEYAWCCGAGGGVKEAYPDFALWTATERLKEAKAIGVRSMVTACGWCRRNFMDAMEEGADKIEIYDLIELVQKAM